MNKIKEVIKLIPYIVLLGISVFWTATGDFVESDPYLLGLFRGVIMSVLFYHFIAIVFHLIDRNKDSNA